jgi:hypothetical protein
VKVSNRAVSVERIDSVHVASAFLMSPRWVEKVIPAALMSEIIET